MNQNQEELISAFVDNETTEFESRRSINELVDNAALRRCWERYHLVRDALQRNLAGSYDGEFADKLMARLEDESLPLQPQLASGRWRTPAVAVGMAAALAVVGLVAVKSVTSPRTGPELARSGPLDGIVPTGVARSEAPARPLLPVATTTVSGGAPDFHQAVFPQIGGSSARMDSFLVNHAEYALPVGVMPYARVIGYQAGTR